MFDILLYANKGLKNKIDKTNQLHYVGTIQGELRDETSLIEMYITIEYENMVEAPDFEFNYVYIPVFRRYYFVNNITSITNTLWSIGLSVDVLMSYKDDILASEAFIDRNEFEYNPLIVDEKRVIEQGYDVETIELPNVVFSPTDSGCYVLSGFSLGSKRWNY